jgi:iron complex outermembrane receptor protein
MMGIGGRAAGSAGAKACLLGASALILTLTMVPAQAQDKPGAVRIDTRTFNSAKLDFDIPAGDLGAALRQWADAAGLKMLASTDVIAGLRTEELAGRFTAEAALKRLLAGTHLKYGVTGRRSVTVYDPESALTAHAQGVQLDPIQVEGQGKKREEDSVQGFVAKRSSAGAKTDTPLIETPQSVSVVTQEQMERRATQTIDEALRYSPGVSVAGKEDNRFDFASARGFSLVQYLDGLKLGTGSFAASQTEPYLLERVDILQGPASSLYGRSSPGGLLDMISKRPTETPFREIQLQTGSFNRFQGAFDLSGPTDNSGKLFYRLTGIARDADTQVDFVKNQRVAIAPAFTWKPTENTTLTILTSYQLDPSGGLYGRLPAVGSLYPASFGFIPTNFFFGDLGFNSYERSQYSAGYQFEHRFSNNFLVRQNARYRHIDLAYNFLYATTYLNPTTLRRNIITDTESLDAFSVDNHAELTFSSGPTSHKVLAGLDYNKNDWGYFFGVGASVPLNLLNPNYHANIVMPAISQSLKQNQSQVGMYIQDQIKFGGFVMTLGGRYDLADMSQDDKLKNTTTYQSDRAFTGRAGLNYVFDNGVAPYVSYTESFEPTIGTDFFGNPFKPTTGQQYEVGVKYQPNGFNGFFTFAAFDLTQQNVLTDDPDPSHGNARIQTGEIRSKGIQVAGTVSLAEGFNLVATYSTLDNKVTQSNDGLVGTTPAGVPSYLASGWADYTVQNGPLAGFGFGGGIRYVGATFGDNANTFEVPSYTLVDAALYYDLAKINPALKGLKLAVNANNVFDKTYVAGCTTTTTCYYGFRRSVLATLTYRW